MPRTDTSTLIRQLIGRTGRFDATVLVLAAPGQPELLDRAAAAALTTRDRQLLAIVAAHLDGDADRVDALARDHLADYPDSLIVAWIVADGVAREHRRSL